MTQIIDGNKIALEITQKIARDIFDNALEKRPGLAIILAGNREDSTLYVNIKQTRAKEVGIDTHLYKIKDNEDTEDIIELIEHLNNDREIDGILVQLPLPPKYDTNKIITTINPNKDVDCFHPKNLQKLDNYKNEKPLILSPVYGTVLLMLKKIFFNYENKRALIVTNSEIFGSGLQKILQAKGAEVEFIFSDDKNFLEKIKKADLLITAVGQKNLITAEMLKTNVVIVDIGISKENGKIYGDVDFADAKEMAWAITPVPGGVGPVTVAKLLENTWRLAKIHKKLN
jgi:methylenetetrahydrofolate dehydrogenase (NADP+)/methenyltetrahydrofolate cyclohydrolase